MYLITADFLHILNKLSTYTQEYEFLKLPSSHRSKLYLMSSYIQGPQIRYLWTGSVDSSLINIYAFNSFLSRIKYFYAYIYQNLGIPGFFVSRQSLEEESCDIKYTWLVDCIFAIQYPPKLDADKRYVLSFLLHDSKVLYIKVYLSSPDTLSASKSRSNLANLKYTYEPFFSFPKYNFLTINGTICSLCVTSQDSRNLVRADLDYILTSAMKAQTQASQVSFCDIDYYQSCAGRALHIINQLPFEKRIKLDSLVRTLNSINSNKYDSNSFDRFVFSHGDFVPWNIKFTKSNFTLIDLDGAFMAPFGYDIIYCIIQSYAFNFIQFSQATMFLRRFVFLKDHQPINCYHSSIRFSEAELSICILVADLLKCKNNLFVHPSIISPSMFECLKKYSRIISVLL